MTTKDRFAARIAGFNVVLVLIGALIISVWTVLMFRELIFGVPSLGILVAAFMMMVGFLIHFAALSIGNHIISWGASTFVASIALFGVVLGFEQRLWTDLAVVAGVSVLAYNESLRLSFAQRRDAVVDQKVYFSSAISIAVIGLFAAIGVQAAKLGVSIQPTEGDGETLSGQNWWVLVSVIVLILAVVLVLFVPTVRRRRQVTKRIQPGQRIDLSTINLSDQNNQLDQS